MKHQPSFRDQSSLLFEKEAPNYKEMTEIIAGCKDFSFVPEYCVLKGLSLSALLSQAEED